VAKHLIASIWRNATPMQATLIFALLIVLVIILLIAFVKIMIPFTYIAI